MTFALAMLFSFFAETTLVGVPIPVAVLVLAIIILIGIVFDVVGIAVTFQEVTAYTAMASKRIPGAKQAIRLVQESDTVSNICNDVVGDICGIVSGAMGAAISLRLITASKGVSELLVGIVISGLI
ncbi:MAG: Mg2+ and Co2+ transporter CorB, partial [Eubacteriales bacterium]|nr:Mg2+ and Co2+ transporter CorB [Eubacteriales bacterium]